MVAVAARVWRGSSSKGWPHQGLSGLLPAIAPVQGMFKVHPRITTDDMSLRICVDHFQPTEFGLLHIKPHRSTGCGGICMHLPPSSPRSTGIFFLRCYGMLWSLSTPPRFQSSAPARDLESTSGSSRTARVALARLQEWNRIGPKGWPFGLFGLQCTKQIDHGVVFLGSIQVRQLLAGCVKVKVLGISSRHDTVVYMLVHYLEPE